jgi:phosphatidate cytidylyltransferase
MNIDLKKRIITSIFLIMLLFLMYAYAFIMIISLIIIAIISWIEFYALISKIFSKDIPRHKFLRIVLKAVSLLYLSMVTLFIILNLHLEHGIFIVYSLLIAIASDIGGLIIGRTIKGKKLTKISPKKTISGSIGSFIFSLLIIPFFVNKLNIDSILILILITLFISLASQSGDLFISLLKRRAKVKDTSDILPGHGGLLDRIDGIIFAIPVGVLLMNFS